MEEETNNIERWKAEKDGSSTEMKIPPAYNQLLSSLHDTLALGANHLAVLASSIRDAQQQIGSSRARETPNSYRSQRHAVPFWTSIEACKSQLLTNVRRAITCRIYVVPFCFYLFPYPGVGRIL